MINNYENQGSNHMGPIEDRIKELAKLGNIDSLIDTLQVALESPSSPMAERLESVGLRYLGYEYFTGIKNELSNLHGQQPNLADDISISTLSSYEDVIKEYLKKHTKTVALLTGSPKLTAEELRVKTLDKFQESLEAITNETDIEFLKKTFREMSDTSVDSEGLRRGIDISARDITEIVWGVVTEGREASAEIVVERPVEDIKMRYEAETSDLFIQATDTAARVIHELAATRREK